MEKTIAFFWENYEFGGVSTNLASLINSKKFRKKKISIFSNKSNKALIRFKKLIKKPNKIKIITFKNYLDLNKKNKILKLFLILFRPLIFFFTLFKIFNLLKRFKIDIFISQCGGYGDFRSDLGSIIIAKILNFPKIGIVFHHSYSKPIFWAFTSNLINSFIIFFANRIIFVSKATFKNMSKTIFFKFKKTNIKIINNGIEINKINTNYKISNLIEKKFINGIVLARVQEDKGHEDLIKAFRLLPKDLKNKIKIFFIGDGNEKYIFYLKKLIKDYELNNNFYFIGYIDGNGRDIIKYFDFLVSPSRYFEGFGLSIVESLSVGTIVVSTKVGGVTDYLDNSNSFLVNPFNKKQISNALIKISRNPKELMNKKANGIQLVKTKLTNNNMGQNYIKFLD